MTPTDTRATTLDTRLLIAGERVNGEGGALAVENPATEEEIAPKEWWYPYGRTGDTP